ncbi:MAG: NifB/NifX family molybdenum-iron cluster-binding protein [Arcobacteraceae bacterium]|nr:NifB/NifX family molybdenum-iron cluster-binding protein [Arcobacteraceae bacterium]
MLAIPIDTPNSTVISQLYGNAPFFALMDLNSGNFSVVKNEGLGDGEDTAQFVANSGTSCTIFYHMGEGLFNRLQESNINVYSCAKVDVTLDEIYINCLQNDFKLLDANNATALLDAGTCTCKKKA